jgi:hypothetical protein
VLESFEGDWLKNQAEMDGLVLMTPNGLEGWGKNHQDCLLAWTHERNEAVEYGIVSVKGLRLCQTLTPMRCG